MDGFPNSQRQKQVIVIASWFLFAIIFVLLHPIIGLPAASLSTIPVILMAWFYGTRAGFIAGLMTLPITIGLVILFQLGDVVYFIEKAAAGILVAILSGVTIGRLREIGILLKEEIELRKLAEQRTQQQLEMLRALYAGANQIAHSLDYQELVTRALQICSKVQGIDQVLLYEVGSGQITGSVQGSQSVLDSAQNDPVSEIERHGENLAQQVLLGKSPIVKTFDGKYRLSEAGDGRNRLESYCLAGFALICKENVLGSLILVSAELDTFSASRLEFFQAFSYQVAAALENALQFGEQKKLALTDSLTGLANRRSLDDILELELNHMRVVDQSLCVLLIDIDEFKMINDQFGHIAGDQVLITFASILNNQLREEDIAARFGGDEFAVILPKTGMKAAREVAERLRQIVEQHRNESAIPVTCSIGIASSLVDGGTPKDILHAADYALYQAKQKGGNQIEVKQIF